MDSRDQSNMMNEVEDYLDDDLSEEMRDHSRRKTIYFEED